MLTQEQTQAQETEYEFDLSGLNAEFNLKARNEPESDMPETTPESDANESQGAMENTDEFWFVENAEKFIVDSAFRDENMFAMTRVSDFTFQETIGRIYVYNKESARALGMLMWKRLREKLGFEQAKSSRERSAQIWKWAAALDREDSDLQRRLDRWIDGAMARDLVPATENLSPTASNEISDGIKSNDEDVVKDTIEQRNEAVKQVDPNGENSTQTVRDVKQHERVGNYKPSVIRRRDLSGEQVTADYVFEGRMKLGETVTGEGEIVPIEEHLTYARLVFEMPKSEELRPQYDIYQKSMLRRIGGVVSDVVENQGE